MAIPILNELNSIAPCYIKGGAVRDKIMGRTPSDYDFLFVGDIEEVKKGLGAIFDSVWSYRKLNIVGFARKGEKYEACIVDSTDNMEGRADYTINSLLMGSEGHIEGKPQWVADAKWKMLRMNSEKGIRNDAIRAVRGIRLAHSHSLSIDSETFDVIKDVLPRMVLFDPKAKYGVSRNRLRKEIKKCNDHAKHELVALGLEIPEKWL
jgi:tRNA nucleotidyltransferase/poly(A) polymerase